VEGMIETKDLMKILKVSEVWVYKAVSNNSIPFFRLGGKLLRFYPSEIEAWIRERKNLGLRMPRKTKNDKRSFNPGRPRKDRSLDVVSSGSLEPSRSIEEKQA
jgi:excisionase family DNA binding protein